MTHSKEFQKFDQMMGELLKVPHSELKKKLDQEKEEKQKRKRKAAKKPSRVSSEEKPSSD
jgi:hypothetical protein